MPNNHIHLAAGLAPRANPDATTWDVIVVGAGAAGLMAAIHAAERGRRVLILEKNRKPGVKILMSGGTRCNITHATDNRGIVAAYGQPGKFLHSALAAFTVQDTIDFFESEGVATKVEETGKVFPVSNKALDVLDALLARLNRSGAVLAVGEGVLELGFADERHVIRTTLRALNAGRIILTTGGQSYPGSGTTGDGYRFAQQLGHRIVPPRPALVPLTTSLPWVAELRGITLPDVAVRILDGERALIQRRGSLLFAHFGLSGPVILDVSRVVSEHFQPDVGQAFQPDTDVSRGLSEHFHPDVGQAFQPDRPVPPVRLESLTYPSREGHATLALDLDLAPQMSDVDMNEWLRHESQASGKKQLAIVLTQHAPRRLADIVLGEAGLPIDRKAAALTKEDRQRIVHAMKHLRIPITGTLGFKKAEVTAGGVALDEVDSRTMESKLVPGLFLAGEILDLDGPIGGYNFQAAWSTGWLAGGAV
ncbi:MAG: NAD(P)/FAD-dependent oxidoreductase [Planctomycetes bacterium]|nr:NAD(P)/FAD-dependent oxidoreductase [Planctomycetota bacterium]